MSKIDSVLTIVTELKTEQASMKEWRESTHERIFGGQQPGAIQYLHAADEKLAETIRSSNKELIEALAAFKSSVEATFTAVKGDITELKAEKRVTKAYAAGAVGFGTAIGYLIKSGIIKLASIKFGG